MKQGNPQGMQGGKRPRKKWLATLLAVGGLLAAAALVYCLAIPLYHYFSSGAEKTDRAPEIAKKSDFVDYNEENGELYINDEIIVITKNGVEQEQVEKLAKSYKLEIVGAMPDIGFWKMQTAKPLEYKKLNSTVSKLSKEDIVESAYINTLFQAETDVVEEAEPDAGEDTGTAPTATEPEDTFDYRDPVYPNDSWDSASWDQDVPRGSNWGVEAIRAPGAWAYDDLLEPVRVGLIDNMVDMTHEDLNVTAFVALTTEGTADTSVSEIDNSSISAQDHGSHVAGTIGANWNSRGVTGVAGSQAELYYCAAYYTRDGSAIGGYYDAFNYVAAIRTLVLRDVKVINISQNTSRLIGFAASRGNSNAITHLRNNAEIAEAGLRRLVEQGYEFVLCVAAGNSNAIEYYPDEDAPYGYREECTFGEAVKMQFGWHGEKGDSQAKYNNFLNLIEDETVKSRIIVVGAVGINHDKSTETDTRYTYSYFSNIGERVDVVAPGQDVYSSVPGGYGKMSGTSMATPHVTGVCGLVFGANPALSGAEVKKIVLASTYGRWCYTGGYSGMVDAQQAVVYALKTRDESVHRVIHTASANGLDICFVVDTTGSMDDDIANAKENMVRILDELAGKTEDYRVALIDYRDFPERASAKDYPAKLQLPFSGDQARITEAIQSLTLGDGGDTKETVYSALMMAAGLDWRGDAVKAVIVLGDAPPLDPEPVTGYDFGDVTTALYNADIKLDMDTSDDRVLGSAADSLIKVYTIGTDASDAAASFFEELSAITGGAYTGVDSADKVSDAIVGSIEKIEVDPRVTAKVDFGTDYSGETVELYRDGEYLFEVTLDRYGCAELMAMEVEEYHFAIPRLLVEGRLDVNKKGKDADISFSDGKWYDFAVNLWQRHRPAVIAWTAGTVVLLSAIAVAVFQIKQWRRVRALGKQLPVAAVPQTSGYRPPAGDGNVQQTAYCGYCGTRNDGPVRFCKACGKPLEPR